MAEKQESIYLRSAKLNRKREIGRKVEGEEEKMEEEGIERRNGKIERNRES